MMFIQNSSMYSYSRYVVLDHVDHSMLAVEDAGCSNHLSHRAHAVLVVASGYCDLFRDLTLTDANLSTKGPMNTRRASTDCPRIDSVPEARLKVNKQSCYLICAIVHVKSADRGNL